jgi:hypothetical protein
VLLTGLVSSLLWEHGGEVFRGHINTLLLCLFVLPLIGGLLTPEKPAYTAIVFAVGSYPPLDDIGPMPIGLWPFWSIYTVLSGGYHPATWHTAMVELSLMIAIPAVVAAAMSLAYVPLVYIGWTIRRRLGL